MTLYLAMLVNFDLEIIEKKPSIVAAGVFYVSLKIIE
jgi:hypothetical protein